MNVYVVTEGKVEAIVYRHWIPFVNKRLSAIESLAELNTDNFYIVSANGYPDYFDVIESAIDDVNCMDQFTRLVISADSEDLARKEKFHELSEFVAQRNCRVEIRIIVQHFCFETWALGNRKIIRPNTSSVRLREYRRVFDVRSNDPELLPPKPDEELNRAQFAERYLRIALNDKFRNLSYTKRDPRALLNEKYFSQLVNRLMETDHIGSFGDFIEAFR